MFISDKNIKPEEALATINVYQYTHLDDTDVMVKLVSVELNQSAILCMAFPGTLKQTYILGLNKALSKFEILLCMKFKKVPTFTYLEMFLSNQYYFSV